MRRAAVAAVLAAAALLAGCTTSPTAAPTTTTTEPNDLAPGGTALPPSTQPTPTPSTSAPTTTSATTITLGTGSATPTGSAGPGTPGPSGSTTPPGTTTAPPDGPVPTGPWPTTLSAAQVTDAQAALKAYRDYWDLVDRSGNSPGNNWSTEIQRFTADSVSARISKDLAALAKNGIHTEGTVSIDPEVTGVQPSQVDIRACVDSTAQVGIDAAGQRITAPDKTGSYKRYVQAATVMRFVDGGWRVSYTHSDRTRTC